MNRKLIIIAGVALMLPIFIQTSHAAPIASNDGYVGADDHGYGDVIGRIDYFDIKSLNIGVSGTFLSVDIYTNFSGRGDDKLYAAYTQDGNGIGYGDLFLSSQWTPHADGGTSELPYRYDNNSNGTVWTYGFALDNRYSATGGTGTLYQLTSGNNDADALLAGDFIQGNAIWRDGQEIAVDTGSNGVINTSTTGAWSVFADHLTFSFDISGTTLMDGPEIAAHWGMTCGNDVIEGAAPVPEPATMFLFGAGLFGLATINRKKRGK